MKEIILLYNLIIADKDISNMYNKVYYIIVEKADKYSVPEDVLSTILFIESKFNNNAVSHTGVKGIAQITRITRLRFGIGSSIESQIDGCAKILKYNYDNLPEYYNNFDRWSLSALIYNRGKGVYWYAKKKLIAQGYVGSSITIDRILNVVKHRKGGLEGYNYTKRFRRLLRPVAPNK